MAARDIIQAAAGAAGATEANYIEDVFSTWLYNGTETARTISNGIDLSTKGGMVWIKSRTTAEIPNIYDTARGAQKMLYTSGNLSEYSRPNGLTAFNTTGFSLGIDGNYELNSLSTSYASWTFRKQPKFFDVVTFTGDGTSNRQIAHSLGATPGMVIVKCTSSTAAWPVWHRSLSGSNYNLYLNTTGSSDVQGDFSSNGSVSFSSTTFPVSNGGLTNSSGQTYVAYLFADSNSGGFGSAGTDSVVACGSFTGNSTIALGWEPQYLLLKRTDSIGNWRILDNMRGLPVIVDGTGSQQVLLANTSGAESADGIAAPTATGFKTFLGAGTYIYLAIRRGPMKTPTDATKVFATVVDTSLQTNDIHTAGFPVDLDIGMYRAGGPFSHLVFDRLRGAKFSVTSKTDAESDYSISWDIQTGVKYGSASGENFVSQLFRRAPGFFDVVCYTGTGSATTVAHNLGVAPELMIVKSRSDSSLSWPVYYGDYTAFAYLNASSASYTGSAAWNANPTASVFSVGTSVQTNYTSSAYVAYLFATCPGVSKVGSYTGTGTTKQIDCGFAAGARFVLIKRTDSTGNWYVWDSARGIVSGNDPYLLLNSTAAEVTNTDYIDPYSAGFEISSTAPAEINASGGSFVFLAVA